MSTHASNIKAFVAAADAATDDLTKAYCGLVAIELVLKQVTGLKDHNVPSALIRFSHKFAIAHLKGCNVRLTSLSTQLSDSLHAISVQDKNGTPCAAPRASYPYIRYTRHAGDGWPTPSTSAVDAKALADVVASIRSYLKFKFSKNL